MQRVFDFRFANLAIGFWLGVLGCFSIVSDSRPWMALIIGAAVSLAWISQKPKYFLTVFLLGALVCAVRFHILHQSDSRITKINDQVHEFEISSDPFLVPERFGGDLEMQKDIFLYADLIHGEDLIPMALTIDEEFAEIASALPTSKWSCLLQLKIAPPNRRYVAFGTCLDTPIQIQNEKKLQTYAGFFRTKLLDLTFNRIYSDAAALLPGLVIGDNRAQSSELVQNLRISGLGHLTAVSGANVAILLLFVQFLLQKTQLSDNWRFLILLMVLILFVIVARPSPSVVRAAMMAAIALLYWIKGLQKLSEGILFLAVLVLLFLDPWLALSWGFALSAAATLGLILLPRFWNIDSNSPILLKAFTTALAASLATLPVLLAMGSVVTIATIPANILAELMVAPATIFGLIAPVVSLIPAFNSIAILCANIAIGSAAVIVKIAEIFANSFFAVPILSWNGIATVVLGFFAYRMRGNRVWLIAIAIIGSLSFFSFSRIENRWQIPNWQIAVCDVGQGDATLIRTGINSAMVVDVGPDPRLMRKCLETFGVQKIDLFVASHFHADHVGGISGMAEVATPTRVITASLSVPIGGFELLEKELSPVKREIAKVGMRGEIGENTYRVFWQVLAPLAPVITADESNGSLINNNSVVLLVVTAHHRILLTGDIEIDAQESLMKSISNPNVDIVKVPHHGSAYQAPNFAKWLAPDLAWISVAEENSYGHPNPTTISLYRSTGAEVLTTSLCGHILIGDNSFSTSRPCV